MPQRTFSLTDEASQKLDRMAEQEERTLTAVLNRIIMHAEVTSTPAAGKEAK